MPRGKSSWTKDQIDDLILMRSTGRASAFIAEKLGKTDKEVRHKLSGLKRRKKNSFVPGVNPPLVQTTLEDDTAKSDAGHLQRSYASLMTKYQAALKANSAVNQLVADIKSVAPLSYSATPRIQSFRKPGKSSAQSALLLFSDTHIGKFVEPSQTLGMGEYNFDIFLARLKYLEESTTSILANHTTTEIEELVICMLGDMLDGALNHGVEAGQKTTLFSQYYNGAHAIAQFLRALSTRVPKIRIKTVVGNHTRWATQRKMPTENRYSNLDQFLYALIQALVADIPTIQFPLDAQPFSIFEVQNHVFQASHGDHLRGGDGGMGIPSRSYAREISARAQLLAKNGQRQINYYLSGHLHREISLPHTAGSCLVNGAFVGLDGYGLTENFAAVDPSQRLVFVHPKHGLTAEYGLSLKWAKVTEKPPYTIPAGFPVV